MDKKNSLKILLLYPRYPDTFWSFRHAIKFVSKKAFIPPLGLLTVAALLPREWERRLADLNVSELNEEDIQWADYVFLSAMEVQQTSVKEIVVRVKALGKKIVGGGPLFTISPDRFPEIDHLVLHEAEATLPPFIEDLKKGEVKRIYTATEWPDITSSPIPEWNLLDMMKYAVMCLQYSRGCPYDCEFCDISLLNGKKPRTKTSNQILCELDTLYQAGWKGVVFFGDDNFIGKPEKLKKEVLPALITWMEEKGYPFSFLTQTTINLADDQELMELMVRAGFDSVFIGIETPEEKSLRECNKVQNKDRNPLAAVRNMQRFGLEVTGGFIVGFDSDPPDIFQKQIDFIQESGIVTAMVGLLNALKGTKLYERLLQEGRLLGDFTGDNTDFTINFISKMGSQRLLEGYRNVVRTIYSPRQFYRRLTTFLNNYNPPKRGGGIIKLHHIKAFFHSILVLGIWGEERFYYWKNLIWTLLRHRRLFPVYVRLSIYGYHFRKVFQTRFENLKLRSGCQPLEGLRTGDDVPFHEQENTREKDNFLKKSLPRRLPIGNMDDDSFNAEHCMSIGPAIERLILHSYQSIVLPEENKKKIIDLGTSSILYASLHKSHLDYVAICGKMFLEGLPCPRTIAGSNLLKGMIGRSVKQFTGIDLIKWGAIPVERDSAVPRTIHHLCNRIGSLLRSNKPVLAFPEIEMTTNGNGYTIRTGRAYTGKIRKFAPALFSPAINASKEGKKVFIVPISVAYDFVAEEGYFSRLINADKMKKSENSLISLMGRLYYTFLESHFFYKMYSLGKGNIYIDTGQPILVEPNASKTELAQRAQEEAAKCARVTMPALVCYAISRGVNTKDELKKSVERYATELREAKANFHTTLRLEESIELALQDLELRKTISNGKSISVKRPEIITYYANTIAHHFE